MSPSPANLPRMSCDRSGSLFKLQLLSRSCQKIKRSRNHNVLPPEWNRSRSSLRWTTEPSGGRRINRHCARLWRCTNRPHPCQPSHRLNRSLKPDCCLCCSNRMSIAAERFERPGNWCGWFPFRQARIRGESIATGIAGCSPKMEASDRG